MITDDESSSSCVYEIRHIHLLDFLVSITVNTTLTVIFSVLQGAEPGPPQAPQ